MTVRVGQQGTLGQHTPALASTAHGPDPLLHGSQLQSPAKLVPVDASANASVQTRLVIRFTVEYLRLVGFDK